MLPLLWCLNDSDSYRNKGWKGQGLPRWKHGSGGEVNGLESVLPIPPQARKRVEAKIRIIFDILLR